MYYVYTFYFYRAIPFCGTDHDSIKCVRFSYERIRPFQ